MAGFNSSFGTSFDKQFSSSTNSFKSSFGNQPKSIEDQLNDVESQLAQKEIEIPKTGEKFKFLDILNILRYPITNFIYTAVQEQAQGDGLGLDDFGKIVKSAALGLALKEKHNSEDVLRMRFPNQKEWVYKLGGLAGDILTDPLTYLSFGTAGGAKGAAAAATKGAEWGANALKVTGRKAMEAGVEDAAKTAIGQALMKRFGGKTIEDAVQNGIRLKTKDIGGFGLRLGVPFTNKSVLLAKGTPLDWAGKAVSKVNAPLGQAITNLPTTISKVPIVGNVQKIFDTSAKYGPLKSAKDIEVKQTAIASRELELKRDVVNDIFKDAVTISKTPSPLITQIVSAPAAGVATTLDAPNKVLYHLQELRDEIAAGRNVIIPPELQALNTKVQNLTDGIWKELEKRGMTTTTLKDPITGIISKVNVPYKGSYFPRYYVNKQTKEAAVITRMANSKFVPNINFRKIDTAIEAEKLGFTPVAPMEAIAMYIDKTQKAIAHNDLVQEMVDKFALQRTTTATKQMKDWMDVEVPGFEGKMLPKDMARVVNESYQIVTNPTAAKPFIDAINAFQNAWKKTVTIVNPGFHARNLLSNAWTILFKDGVGPKQIENFKNAAEIVVAPNSGKLFTFLENGQNVTKKAIDWYDYFRRNAVHSGGFTAVEKTLPDNILKQGKGIVQKGLKGVEAVGSANENTFRVASALNDMSKGLTIGEAAKRVNQYFINYGDLTKTEQTIRKFIPFYSWMKNNLANQLTMMFTQPGKYSALSTKPLAAINGISGEDSQWLPEYMKSDMYIQPFGATSPEGKPLMLNPNLPFQDLGSLTGNPLASLLGKVIEGFSPLLKTPVELTLNKSQFTGNDIAPNQFSTADVPMASEAVIHIFRAVPGLIEKLNIKQDPVTQRWQGPAKIVYALNALLPILKMPIAESIRTTGNPLVEPYKREAAPYNLLSRTAGVKLTPFDTAYYKTKALKERLTLLRNLNRENQ
jgi:hypothetical protein